MGQSQARPTPEQREGLEQFRSLMGELSKFVADACPQEVPATPVARLDAAGNRVQAMLYAGVNLDQAIKAFSAQAQGNAK
jgi:hypothetical protein